MRVWLRGLWPVLVGLCLVVAGLSVAVGVGWASVAAGAFVIALFTDWGQG